MTPTQQFIVVETVIIGTLGLAIAIALGHVEEKSSFGLGVALTSYGTVVAGVFTLLALLNRKPVENPKPVDEPPKD